MGKVLRCSLEVERDFTGARLAGLGGIGLFAEAAYIMIPTCWQERETGDFCWGYMGVSGRGVCDRGGKWGLAAVASEAVCLSQIRLIDGRSRPWRAKQASAAPLNRADIPSLAGCLEWS